MPRPGLVVARDPTVKVKEGTMEEPRHAELDSSAIKGEATSLRRVIERAAERWSRTS
jgi:hypothetical protein